MKVRHRSHIGNFEARVIVDDAKKSEQGKVRTQSYINNNNNNNNSSSSSNKTFVGAEILS